MRVRLKNNHKIEGTSNKFNISSVNEVIVCYDDGSQDSEYISNLEVLYYGHWIELSFAFTTHTIVTDNENTEFFLPHTIEEQKCGYRLTNLDSAKLQAEAYDCRFTLSGD